MKFWTAATSIESLKEELGLHQEDSNPEPFQLSGKLLSTHSAENYNFFKTCVIGAICFTFTQIYISMTEIPSSLSWGWASG